MRRRANRCGGSSASRPLNGDRDLANAAAALLHPGVPLQAAFPAVSGPALFISIQPPARRLQGLQWPVGAPRLTHRPRFRAGSPCWGHRPTPRGLRRRRARRRPLSCIYRHLFIAVVARTAGLSRSAARDPDHSPAHALAREQRRPRRDCPLDRLSHLALLVDERGVLRRARGDGGLPDQAAFHVSLPGHGQQPRSRHASPQGEGALWGRREQGWKEGRAVVVGFILARPYVLLCS